MRLNGLPQGKGLECWIIRAVPAYEKLRKPVAPGWGATGTITNF